MAPPLLGLLLVATVTLARDVTIYHGVNQYDWKIPDKLIYDYKGLVNPTVEKVIADAETDWTWDFGNSDVTLNVNLSMALEDPKAVYTKRPVPGESTFNILALNGTHLEDFIGTIGVPRYPLETSIISAVIHKPYIIPFFDSPTLNDLDNSGFAKFQEYSNTIRLGPPPSFIANATLAFLQKFNAKGENNGIGISMFIDQHYGNVPLGASIKSTIKATYGDWAISDYTFNSDALSGATTSNDYFFGTFKPKLETLTEKLVQATESARIVIVIGGAEFIRYVTHGLQEALESKGKTMEHNDWMVLAIPTNLYPKPSWKAEDLMQVRLDTFKEEDDAEVLNIYQSMFVLSDDIADDKYEAMSDYAIDHFDDAFNGTDFEFNWTINRQVPNYVGYYKDSYLIYLYMLKNHPDLPPSEWMSVLKGKTFSDNDFGSIGTYLSKIQLDQYGDQKWSLNFHHLGGSSGPVWEKVGTFTHDSSKDQDVYTDVKTIKEIAWPNGASEPPLYMPECGTYGECIPLLTDTIKLLLIIVVALIAVFCIAAPLLYLCYQNSQYEMELNNMGWRIGIEELQSTNKGSDDLDSLDGSEGSVKGLDEEVGEDDDDVEESHDAKKALYSNTLVSLKPVMKKHFGITTRELMIEMKQLRDMRDEYIVSVIGLCMDLDSCWLVLEDCPKGTLESVLEDEATELDSNFKLNMIEDIAKGVHFIHQKLGSHGYLKTSNILVSKHFTMKVSDFGEHVFSSDMNRIHGLPELEHNQRLLWRAPELNRLRNIPMNGTKPGDCYSFAIIMHEIINRQGPFNLNAIDNEETPTSIMLKIKSGEAKRPTFTSGLKYKPLVRCKNLCIKCWNEDAEARPNFKTITSNLKKIKPGKSSGTFLDTAVKRLEKYSVTVEQAAVEKEKLAANEQKKVDDIMECFIPKSVIKKMDQFEPTTIHDCTVAVIELTGCTTASLQKEVAEVIAMDMAFHACVDKKRAGFEKVDIGSINIVVLLSRLSNSRSPHNRGLVKVVASIVQAMEKEMREKKMNSVMGVRAGIHTGFIRTGIVGDAFSSVQRFGILGPTINMAESLCSVCESFEMLVSPDTHTIIQNDKHDEEKVVFDFGARSSYQDAGETLEAFCLKCKDVEFLSKADKKPSPDAPKDASAPVYPGKE